MAGRNYTPVNFALEKNVVFLFCRVVFDASGAAILDTTRSKGICAFNLETVAFTGASTNSTTSIGTVSTFAGLYSGMSVTGSASALQATTTIGSISASTGVLQFSKQSVQTGNPVNFFANGGRYRVQFGTQAGVRLDGYNKVLGFSYSIHEVTASAAGSATTAQFPPGVSEVFIVDNKVGTRTIPSTATTSSTDCSLAIQMGDAVGTNFTAISPAAGEAMHFTFILSNSTAP